MQPDLLVSMLTGLIGRIFGTRSDHILNRARKLVDDINRMEPELEKLNDSRLRAKTEDFRLRITRGTSLDELLPEAFAVVREAGKRVFGLRYFDVQLLGGIVLHGRCIAEMCTGEGKTLTAILPAYLNALDGGGVHVVTVNDYLAKRDAEDNRPLFEFLGMKVGVNLQGAALHDKRHAYAADVTYGTNNEYGFDYLRDNMVLDPGERVQRQLRYALLDEIDSILIDEARTPLIISGAGRDDAEMYQLVNGWVSRFVKQDGEDPVEPSRAGHFVVDEKLRQVDLTEMGFLLVERLLISGGLVDDEQMLYQPENVALVQYFIAALRAHFLFARDVDYIVKDGEVIIIDEHTGRGMPGRRWTDGLHQALEAKEGVTIRAENQTLASTTFQNYFRLYEKLAGMTGTASTEAAEFSTIYGLDTVTIPPNRPVVRQDLPDLVYMTEGDKIRAIVEDVQSRTRRGQPVLIGTTSIEKSEFISANLSAAGVPHRVLNAKSHAMEADIISQAGNLGAVTIATNMAGRGTDIVLGGNWRSELGAMGDPSESRVMLVKKLWKQRHDAVIAVGGLHIIGTERHESRRIDDQLRGRAGRQGDVGSSRFYLSIEDPLVQIFTPPGVRDLMSKVKIGPGEALQHPWITRAVVKAQRRIESRNFNVRRHLLEYDDVTSAQRAAVYDQRNRFLETADLGVVVRNIREDVVDGVLNMYADGIFSRDGYSGVLLERHLAEHFGINMSISRLLKEKPNLDRKILSDLLLERLEALHDGSVGALDDRAVRALERGVVVGALDLVWREHLDTMEVLRQGIHLRGYAQRDPKQEYRRESFDMFVAMVELFKHEVTSTLGKMGQPGWKSTGVG